LKRNKLETLIQISDQIGIRKARKLSRVSYIRLSSRVRILHISNSILIFLSGQYYRCQQWGVDKHGVSRKDLGQGLDTSTTEIRPMRPVRFLEERRWPPLEMVKNRWKIIRNNPTSVTCTNICSPPQAHQNCSSPRSFETTCYWKPNGGNSGNDIKIKQSLFNSSLSIGNFNSFKPEFEPPFRVEVTFRI